VAVPLLVEHFGTGLLQGPTERAQFGLFSHLGAEDGVEHADVAVPGQQHVEVVDVSEDLVELYALVDEREHLGRQELIEGRVIHGHDQSGQTAPGHEGIELLELELIV